MIDITKATDKKRILVVDDQARDSRLLKLYLERTNDYEVQEENNAREAVASALKFQPHLIFMDVMMPGIDGGDLASRLQEHTILKEVPIVFLTAIVTKGEVDAGGGRIGKFPFLAKPVVLAEVTACLTQHLG